MGNWKIIINLKLNKLKNLITLMTNKSIVHLILNKHSTCIFLLLPTIRNILTNFILLGHKIIFIYHIIKESRNNWTMGLSISFVYVPENFKVIWNNNNNNNNNDKALLLNSRIMHTTIHTHIITSRCMTIIS